MDALTNKWHTVSRSCRWLKASDEMVSINMEVEDMLVADKLFVPKPVIDAYVQVFEGFPVRFHDKVSVTDPAEIRACLEDGRWSANELRANVGDNKRGGEDGKADYFLSGKQKLVVPSADDMVKALLTSRPREVVTEWSFRLPKTGRRLCQVVIVWSKRGYEVTLLPCTHSSGNLICLSGMAEEIYGFANPFFSWLDDRGLATDATRLFQQALKELADARKAYQLLGVGNGNAPDREAIGQEIEIMNATDRALGVIAPI